MSVIRVHKTKNYTVMSNVPLREKKMSLKAKGMICLMLSLPEDWDYSISGLEQICSESKTAIRSTLRELEKFGYLRVEKVRDELGRINYEYHIFESPCSEEPHSSQPCTRNLYAVNGTQRNTNNKNTNNKNTDNKIKSNKKAVADTPTLSDLEERFSHDISISALEWLEYKDQRKEQYSPMGLKKMLTQLENNIETYGESAVIGIIDESMANGWKGIIYDRLKGRENETNRRDHTEEVREFCGIRPL